jgi:hypothetical protein
MTTPVYERMRSPITPPKAKPLNLPRIRVKKWRKKVDWAESQMHHYDFDMRHYHEAKRYIEYVKDWITYAEAILNDGADPTVPFKSEHKHPYTGSSDDPHHVHPVIKMEDFV